jgi:hypothetical protein
MEAAFAAAFAAGHPWAAIVGTDCPDLGATQVLAAGDALRHHDLVTVPALDGGYTLLALNAPHPALFSDIDWSTDSVHAQTISRAREAGLRAHHLPALRDVDTAADWRAFGSP